ncbi:antigen 5-related 2 [Glossina fuscipes fuscipes]
MKFVLATLSLLVLVSAGSGNYCNLCEKHVACVSQNVFQSGCSSDAKMIDLKKYQTTLLDAHNKKRDHVAGGGESKLKRACRMATMKWNSELAKLAEYNVRQCEMNHDKCRNTNTFKYAGQNLAELGRSGAGTPDYGQLIQKAVDSWYEEVNDCNQGYIDSYPKDYKGPAIGHFTVMVAERNTHMGCAASQYTRSNGFTYFLLACNYATTNMMEFPIYKSCSVSAKDCKTGKNSKYQNLCSANEKYEVNRWFKNGVEYQ